MSAGATPARTSASPRDPDREILAPLLLRRFRLIAPSVILGTLAFAVLHVVLDEPRLPLLLGLKFAQVGLIVAGLRLCARYPNRRMVVANLFVLASILVIVIAITGTIIGNVHTNALLFVAVALASASFLPWGPVAQTALVFVSSAAAVLPFLVVSPYYHGFWYDLASLAVAFAISIYVSREVEDHTLSVYRAQAVSSALAESRADFEGLFRSSNVLIGIFELTEDDFVYAEVNDALAELFGRTPQAMQGMTGRQVGFTDSEVREWRSILQTCAEKGAVHVPEYCLRLFEPRHWYHLAYSAIRSGPGTPTRFSGVGVDITELRKAKDEIQRVNLDLEAEVQERTSLLEAANKDLESFAYSVSHDLRTPLRTIEGFAALLTTDHASELSPPAREQLDRIRRASRHMAQLIDDMLMLSRASRSEIHREFVDISQLAVHLVAEIRATKEERDVTVHVESGLAVYADPQLMRIVMANLLGNAWKYTSRSEEARIEVAGESFEDEDVIVIRDNGCGFDMRFVEKLFQPFQRLHTDQEFEGTGIGLATVARIIRRHGGRVWAEGGVGQGATFRFAVGGGPPVNPS